jgi:hypothetical protein
VHGLAVGSHIFPGINILADVFVGAYGGAKYGAGALVAKAGGQVLGDKLKTSGLWSLSAAGASIGGSCINSIVPFADMGVGAVAHGAMVYKGVNNIRS